MKGRKSSGSKLQKTLHKDDSSLSSEEMQGNEWHDNVLTNSNKESNNNSCQALSIGLNVDVCGHNNYSIQPLLTQDNRVKNSISREGTDVTAAYSVISNKIITHNTKNLSCLTNTSNKNNSNCLMLSDHELIRLEKMHQDKRSILREDSNAPAVYGVAAK